MVERLVQAVGPGVMKLLIMYRGFIDGKNIGRCRQEWGLRPSVLVRREAKRQAKLAQRRPAPDPAEVLTQHKYCWIKGFNSWSELPVPIEVLMIRKRYADGHCQEWALLTTRGYVDPSQARTDYQGRVKIEERHRQLKCFHDLSDFQSRAQNVIVTRVMFILFSYTLRRWQLWRLYAEVSPDQTPELMRRRLNLRKQHIVIYLAHSYAQIPLVRFTRLVLELE